MPAGAAWCSLCYAELQMVTVPPSGGQGASAITGERPAAGWPCGDCGATVPMELPHCPACGRDFLAELHEDGATGVSPLDRLASFATDNRLAALGIGLAACGLFLLFWIALGMLT